MSQHRSRSTSTSRSASPTTSGPSSRSSRASWRASSGSSSRTTGRSLDRRDRRRRRRGRADHRADPRPAIAWKSTRGGERRRRDFHRLDDRKTRVTLQIDVEPEGPVENVGDALGAVHRRVKGDLERFKKFIETRVARRPAPGAARSARTT